MAGDGNDKVIEMKRSAISDILAEDDDPHRPEVTPELGDFMAKWDARRGREAKRPGADQAREHGHGPGGSPGPVRKPQEGDAAEELAPLPTAGSPYEEAYSRLANRPRMTLFFLPEGQLADGFSYSSLERVRMVEPEKPGGSPDLLLRFTGSVITEVRVEGRNLLGLLDMIGRHLIHWVRQHPTGKDDGRAAVFIRRITITEIER